jgi:hypothetical protein
MSRIKLEEKLFLTFKVIFEEITSLVLKYLPGAELLSTILKTNNG